MSNVLAKRSALACLDLPVMPPEEDALSFQLVPHLVKIVGHMAKALRLGWETAMPGTFPSMSLQLPFPVGPFKAICIEITVSRCLTDDEEVVVTLTCPDWPNKIIERRHNLVAALGAYHGGDSSVGLPDVKIDGTFVFILPDDPNEH